MDLAEAEAMEKEKELIGSGIVASWMAPFSVLHRTMRAPCLLPREYLRFQLTEAIEIPASHV
jgi:hypothetical protein